MNIKHEQNSYLLFLKLQIKCELKLLKKKQLSYTVKLLNSRHPGCAELILNSELKTDKHTDINIGD